MWCESLAQVLPAACPTETPLTRSSTSSASLMTSTVTAWPSKPGHDQEARPSSQGSPDKPRCVGVMPCRPGSCTET